MKTLKKLVDLFLVIFVASLVVASSAHAAVSCHKINAKGAGQDLGGCHGGSDNRRGVATWNDGREFRHHRRLGTRIHNPRDGDFHDPPGNLDSNYRRDF